MQEILAVVWHNDYEEAYILKESIDFDFEEIREGVFIGTDGLIIEGYYKAERRNQKAFAGREIELPMSDGSTRKFKDNLWFMDSGVSMYFRKDIKRVPYVSLEKFRKHSNLFYGGYCFRVEMEKLRKKYKGPVFNGRGRDVYSQIKKYLSENGGYSFENESITNNEI